MADKNWTDEFPKEPDESSKSGEDILREFSRAVKGKQSQAENSQSQVTREEFKSMWTASSPEQQAEIVCGLFEAIGQLRKSVGGLNRRTAGLITFGS